MNVSHDMIQCYVFRETGGSHEFLQIRRAPNDYMGGTWQTVAGKIQTGESAVRACLRELFEETGMSALELFRLDRVNSFYVDSTDTLYHCPVFAARVSGSCMIVLNPEHDAWRWTPRASAEAAYLWPSDRECIRQICEEILDAGPAMQYMRVKMQ
jgi:8-oxo-dGTP pyrophosphatase MutT (NUDIX family)